MAAEKKHDDLMSWGDDCLCVDEVAVTKSHEDATSTSSGSSEEVIMVECCDQKQKAKK